MEHRAAPQPAPTSAREAAAMARSAVACARVATLITYARHPAGQLSTTAAVLAREDGSVEVRLAPDAHAVRQLLARPLATVHLAPPGGVSVLLHGAAQRLAGTTDDGRLVFRVEAAAVRVGEQCRPVDPGAYAACCPSTPDLLDRQAPQVLAHLNQAHHDELCQHLRTTGFAVEFAQATELDARGLTVVVVGRRGADTARLDFPAAVENAEHLPAALAALLTRRCACES